jgi:hypothetical protein
MSKTTWGFGMRGRLTVAAVAAFGFSLSGVAAAQALTFHVVHRGAMSARQLTRAERAITFQVNHQVRRYWHNPRIRFGASGVPVYFYSAQGASRHGCGPSASGCHGPGASGPAIWVENQPGWYGAMTTALSHEVVETAVDPQNNRVVDGLLADPCDEAEGATYDVGAVMVADFVFPRWYDRGSSGPWDYMAAVARARSLSTWGAFDIPMG